MMVLLAIAGHVAALMGGLYGLHAHFHYPRVRKWRKRGYWLMYWAGTIALVFALSAMLTGYPP